MTKLNQKLVMQTGLCYNCVVFSGYDLESELKKQFKDANLHSVYPFGEDEYEESCMTNSMHLENKRVAWVQDHIDNPSEGQSENLSKFYSAWMDVRNCIINKVSN